MKEIKDIISFDKLEEGRHNNNFENKEINLENNIKDEKDNLETQNINL